MTRRKRQSRDARRPRPAAAPPEPTTLDLAIPSAGPATFRSGCVLPWRVAMQHVRRPLAFLPLLVACFLVFSLLKMLAIYLVGLVWWGQDTPTQETATWFNTGLWEILSWWLAPVLLAPWFAGRVIFANGLPVPFRLVKEPLNAQRRWLHLLGLGLVGVISAGAVGSQMGAMVRAWGVGPTAATLVGAWWAAQVVLSAAAAGIWRDGLTAPQALWAVAQGARRFWRPALAASLSTAALAFAVLAVFLGMVVAPIFLMRVPPDQLRWFGLLLAPLIALLAAGWWHVRAALGLAFYEWSEPLPEATTATQNPSV